MRNRGREGGRGREREGEGGRNRERERDGIFLQLLYYYCVYFHCTVGSTIYVQVMRGMRQLILLVDLGKEKIKIIIIIIIMVSLPLPPSLFFSQWVLCIH